MTGNTPSLLHIIQKAKLTTVLRTIFFKNKTSAFIPFPVRPPAFLNANCLACLRAHARFLIKSIAKYCIGRCWRIHARYCTLHHIANVFAFEINQFKWMSFVFNRALKCSTGCKTRIDSLSFNWLEISVSRNSYVQNKKNNVTPVIQHALSQASGQAFVMPADMDVTCMCAGMLMLDQGTYECLVKCMSHPFQMPGQIHVGTHFKGCNIRFPMHVLIHSKGYKIHFKCLVKSMSEAI